MCWLTNNKQITTECYKFLESEYYTFLGSESLTNKQTECYKFFESESLTNKQIECYKFLESDFQSNWSSDLENGTNFGWSLLFFWNRERS